MRRAPLAVALCLVAGGALAQDAASLLLRLDAMEAEQRRLVGALEQAQNALATMRRQHDAKLQELEYRIIELEGGDPSAAFRSDPPATEPAPAPAAGPSRPAPPARAAAPGDPQKALLRARSEFEAGRPEAAARHYLQAYRVHGESAEGPALLAGLGESLGAAGRADEACAVFGEFRLRFPEAEEALRLRVARSELQSGCR